MLRDSHHRTLVLLRDLYHVTQVTFVVCVS